VINTARGGVIDEDALTDALQRGQIGGAGLDAFEDEPFPAGHPLSAFDQVVLTPHFAGPTYESWPKRVRFAYENIARVERNERPEAVVHELADLPLRSP
jgi:D-3-phosphoglycerate dehydrogenase